MPSFSAFSDYEKHVASAVRTGELQKTPSTEQPWWPELKLQFAFPKTVINGNYSV
uniref:Uncharacterized protein n=1 Tax=Anguilla anguilla TaxID=7936 RepID=A0A0E9V387_ANGAN